MRILYGSQNFGYNIESSDKDYMDIAYPTLDILMAGGIINRVDKFLNYEIKVKDIRLLPKILGSSNFNDLQILYSQEYIDCDDLNWFIEYRERIVRYDTMRLYKSNFGFIKSCERQGDLKSLYRAYCHSRLLKQALFESELDFKIDLSKERENNVEISSFKDIIDDLSNIKDDFEVKKDYEIEHLVYCKTRELFDRYLKKQFGGSSLLL